MLDAGTGLRQVTALLGGDPFTGTILLTHLHWDHVHGLPFFQGGDRNDARVTLLLPAQESGETAAAALARGMSPPHFPIGPEGLRGDWTFGSLPPGPLKAEGFTVEAREVPHKGGRTYGYRVSDGHSVLTYVPDHCPTVLGPGPEGLGEYHPAALDLAASTPAHPRRVPVRPGGTRRGGVRARGRGVRGRTGNAGRGAAGGAAHHKPGRTDDELDELARRFAGGGPAAPGAPRRSGTSGVPEIFVAAEAGHGVPEIFVAAGAGHGVPEIFVAAEGGILDL